MLQFNPKTNLTLIDFAKAPRLRNAIQQCAGEILTPQLRNASQPDANDIACLGSRVMAKSQLTDIRRQFAGKIVPFRAIGNDEWAPEMVAVRAPPDVGHKATAERYHSV